MSLRAGLCYGVIRVISSITAFALSLLLLDLPPMVAQGEIVLPALPNVFLNTTYALPAGQTIAVPAGGDFQGALNAARSGDGIVLQAGAAYSGNFTLPHKTGSGWIYIQSSSLAQLRPPGNRVSPADAALMPKIISPNTSPAISTAAGANHYRFVGIEIATTWASQTGTASNLIYLEAPGGNTSLSQVPTDIVLDRCYIHGTATGNVRRGIAMNSARTAVVDSYLSNFHEVGADTQAIAAWNGPGPFKIVNNYLEAAGENVMFGGAPALIPNVLPSDIEIRRNYFNKPLSWRVGDPSYAGIHWAVKNLFELKAAVRVLVDGNVFDHTWAAAQQHAIVITPRQEYNITWFRITDVTFTHNIVQNVDNGINMNTADYNAVPPVGTLTIGQINPLARILFQNNLFVNVGVYGDTGDELQFGQSVSMAGQNIVFDHNTWALVTGYAPVMENADAPTPGTYHAVGFNYTNNIVLYGKNGWHSGQIGPVLTQMQTYFSNWTYTGNVVIPGPNPPSNRDPWPAGNFFPASLAAVGFVNPTWPGGNYSLLPTSPYKNRGTDGKDIGVDFTALSAATAGTANASSAVTSPGALGGSSPSGGISITSPYNGGAGNSSTPPSGGGSVPPSAGGSAASPGGGSSASSGGGSSASSGGGGSASSGGGGSASSGTGGSASSGGGGGASSGGGGGASSGGGGSASSGAGGSSSGGNGTQPLSPSRVSITPSSVTGFIMTSPFKPQPVNWARAVNVTAAGSTLKKTGGCDSCHDAGGVSAQRIVSGDGYVEFTTTNITAQYVVSLGNAGTTTRLIGNFALYFSPYRWGGRVQVREKGWTYKTDILFTAGDVFRIAVVGGQVQYSKNGLVFYASATGPVYPLVGMASLWSLGATVSKVMISGSLSLANASQVMPPASPKVLAASPIMGFAVRGRRSSAPANSSVPRKRQALPPPSDKRGYGKVQVSTQKAPFLLHCSNG